MNTLNISSSNTGSKHYDVSDDEKLLTVLDAGSESDSEFVFDNIRYRLTREPGWGDFVLHGPHGEICRASKPSAMFRSFEMDYAGMQWTLAAHSSLGDSFDLRSGSAVAGRLDAKGFFSRRGEATFPGSLPLPVQCFLIWLALLMWARSDDDPGVPIIVG